MLQCKVYRDRGSNMHLPYTIPLIGESVYRKGQSIEQLCLYSHTLLEHIIGVGNRLNNQILSLLNCIDL